MGNKIKYRCLLVGLGCLFLVCSGVSGETTLDWMVKAYGDGRHNAFTDLVQWREHYYLCFRHGATHNSMDGEIRVMRSADLKTWEPCGTLITWGDDRDPHFVVTDDTLYVYFGVWNLAHDPGHGTPDRGSVRSHFASTQDGKTWSKVQGIYEPGWWLWRVRWHDDAFYSLAYTAVRPRPSIRETRLLKSEDGLDWTLVSTVTRERMAGEADMQFTPDGSMWLISRTGDKAGDAVYFKSDVTLTQWTSTDTGVLVHSPVIAPWKNRFFLAGRGRKDGAYVTTVWEFSNGHPEELIVLPSGGDTGYAGLLADPASLEGDVPALFVSWYSQHEREKEPNNTRDTASIYVGRITVAP